MVAGVFTPSPVCHGDYNILQRLQHFLTTTTFHNILQRLQHTTTTTTTFHTELYTELGHTLPQHDNAIINLQQLCRTRIDEYPNTPITVDTKDDTYPSAQMLPYKAL